MVNYAHFIIVFPLLAFLINLFFARRLKHLSAFVSIAASVIAFVLSLLVFRGFQKGDGSYTLGEWINFHGTSLKFGITIDALSVMMLLTVTVIATLIKIYSIGYMQDDPRYSRYFAYLSLFTASMLGLILADNFVMLYIFWEGVGLCSYLLIAFWFEHPAAVRAGLKAFVTTRVGDTGLLLGIFILFFATRTLYFIDLNHVVANEWAVAIAALLIFLGAIGKSAQFPLHVWLPDAMEGPTTVSALIHAATMVAAGVYLIARTYGLFVAYPLCQQTVAVIGSISALMAASIASVNNDIKRILAYSTMSQLGLMMMGLGVGGYNAGTFHLMTHAFFKALLFLCAGSVIHAVHTQDIRKMGGLFSKMKITGTTFVIGMLALSGMPPFSGFWSKDEILLAVLKGHPALFAVAILTSFLTAFYMARLIFIVLFGKPREEMHAQESPTSMTVPLLILAAFAMFIGLIGSPILGHAFQKFMSTGSGFTLEEGQLSYDIIMIFSTAISLTGIALAYILYVRGQKILPAAMRNQLFWLYKLLANKYYVDEIYEMVFVRTFVGISKFSFKFDASIVDGAVNGVAKGFQWLSGTLRLIQSGMVQNYLLIMIIGVIILFVTLWGGK